MSKIINISSARLADVVKEVINLAHLGAYVDNSCPCLKIGPIYTVKVKIEDDSEVVYGPIVKKGASVKQKAEQEKWSNPQVENVDGAYTREQLEVMTLKQLKENTGIAVGKKEEIIEKYLSKEV